MPEVKTIVGRAEFDSMRETLNFITAIVGRTGRKYKFDLRQVKNMVTNKVTYEVEWYKR